MIQSTILFPGIQVRIRMCGNAETSSIELMSHGYSPTAHALYEFPATITGATNNTTAFLHNLTRMYIQLVDHHAIYHKITYI